MYSGRLTQADIYAIAAEVAKHLPVQDEVLTADGVAVMMGKTREAVMVDARRGLIPSHRRGNRVYFSRNEIVRYLTDDSEILRS
jgi:hypothetical protein